MQNNDQPPDFKQTVNGGLALFMFLALMWTRPLQLLSTRPGSAGRRYFSSPPCVLGVLLFPFVMAFAIPLLELPPGQEGFGGVLMFWMLLILAALIHRVRGEALRRTGYGVHSLFWGRPIMPPWITLTFRDTVGHRVKNDALLMMFWGIGFGLLFNSVPLIFYGVFGAFVSYIPVMWYEAQDEARLEAHEDSQHDAEWLAHQLRERRRNRWN